MRWYAFNGIPGRAVCDPHAARDSNGNLANDGTYSYCDALNRLIQVGTPGPLVTPILRFAYDAFGRAMQKVVISGLVPTDYLYLGNQCIEERNPVGGSGSTDTPIRQYIWGTYIDECIQLTTLTTLGPQSLPAGAYYLLQDLLYRAVALTNSSGSVVEAYDCDAYGNTLIFTGPSPDGVWFADDDVQSSYGANEVIYCGYRYDPEAELYYVRNRTYSPVLGRWLQRDSIGYAAGVNLYEYVGGRAAVGVDPTGTQGCLNAGPVGTCCQPPRARCANDYCDTFAGLAVTPALANPNTLSTGFSLISSAQFLELIDKIEGLDPTPGMEKQARTQIDQFIKSLMLSNGYSVWVKVDFLSCDNGEWGQHHRYSLVNINAGSPLGAGVFGGQAGGRKVTAQEIRDAIRSALRPAGGC